MLSYRKPDIGFSVFFAQNRLRSVSSPFKIIGWGHQKLANAVPLMNLNDEMLQNRSVNTIPSQY